MKKMDGMSKDLLAENIAQLKMLFPEAVTEGKVDFDVLKSLLGGECGKHNENYQFTWNGKDSARACAQKIRSSGTLRPCVEESAGKDGTPGKFDSGNLYIEGDNLEVLKLLQGSCYSQIKMIYIDPPYNTGRKFIYPDDYKNSLANYKALTGQTDSEGKAARANPETSGRYHTNWLNMIYPRLILARNLLMDEGIIFISISDEELANLRKVCDDVFGEENFIGCAGRITKKSNNKGDFWAPNFDYLLTYAKNKALTEPFLGGVNEKAYDQIEEEGPRKGERYQLVRLFMSSIHNRNPEQRYWIDCPDGSRIIPPGETFPPRRPDPGDGIWRWTKAKFDQNRDKILIKQVKSSNLLNENHEPAKWNVYTKTYLKDVLDSSSAKPNSFIEDHINQIGSHELHALDIPFDYAKPTTLISWLMEIVQIKSGDTVMDFFSGSATSADAVMRFNAATGKQCRYIMVQLPQKCGGDDETLKAAQVGYANICEIGKERIRRAASRIKERSAAEHLKKKNGKRKIAENKSSVSSAVPDLGFKVFKLDTSCFLPWNPRAGKLEQELLNAVDNVLPGRTDLDLIYEILLKCNLPLTMDIEERKFGENTVYLAGKGALAVCLDKTIPVSIAEDIVKLRDEYAPDLPMQVVFRDNGFDDGSKANVLQTLKQAGFDERAVKTV